MFNWTTQYITFVAYVGTDGADSFFLYMNLHKAPLMIKELSETLHEVTGLPENDAHIKEVVDNFEKAGKVAEQMTI